MIDESAKVVAVSTSSILQVLKNFITIKSTNGFALAKRE